MADALPFNRGFTYFNGATPSLTDGLNLEGKEYWIEDKWYSSGRPIKLKCVRNTSGITLLPKRIVSYSLTANEFGRRVDGYTYVTAQDYAGVVDELLTAGVPANDLFFIVVDGPTIVQRNLANYGSAIAVGDRLIALTAATSGATTAGRLGAQGASSTQLTSDYVQNVIGRALSAIVTSAVTVDPLILVGRR